MTPRAQHPAYRAAALRAAAVGALFACVTGCAEKSTAPVRAMPADTLPALIVSSPFHGTAGSGSVKAPGSTSLVGDGVVYVSAEPGSIPAGLRVTVTDQADGRSVTTDFVAGGFDPVPLTANIGDTLSIQVALSGAAPIIATRVVRPYRPPTVVRTNPPPKQVDVPLNNVMVVVFSVPIDSSSLNAGSVQLWRDTMQVAGAVRFSDATQIKAEFHPDSALAAGTDYRLVISQSITDENGLKLESVVTVPFTTAGTAPPTGGAAFLQVSAGATHTCGLTAGDVAYCWGDNTYGKLGNGTTASSSTPVLVAGGLIFLHLSAGWDHTCGLTTAGDAYCWGRNDSGQLGDGTTQQRTAPVLVAGGITFSDISVGGAHTCAVTSETIVANAVTYCWGSNASGQLGYSSTTFSATPGLVPGVYAQFLSAGRTHTCEAENGDLASGWCWGANDRGQLDDGTTVSRATPTRLTMLSCAGAMGAPPGAVCAFGTVSSGGSHSCAEAAGALYQTYAWYCWGANDSGQLGDGTTTDRTFPSVVGYGMPFIPGSLSAGGQHTCGLSSSQNRVGTSIVVMDGTAYCWGVNSKGQLGDGTTTQHSLPQPVAGTLTFLSVSAGKDSHSCGVTPNGDAWCWGANDYGQLGNGTTTLSTVPVKVIVH